MEFGLGGHRIWIQDSRILATSILQFLLLSFHPFDLNFSKFIRSSLNRDDEIIHLFRDKVSPSPKKNSRIGISRKNSSFKEYNRNFSIMWNWRDYSSKYMEI